MKLCNVSNGRRSLKAVLISLLIIFICASAFCGCVSAADSGVKEVGTWTDLNASLREAGDATITLTADISGVKKIDTINVTSGKKVLNLNGHCINATPIDLDGTETSDTLKSVMRPQLILVTNGSSLDIIGDGTSKSNISDVYKFVKVDGGKLYVDKCTLNVSNKTLCDANPVINAIGASTSVSEYSYVKLGENAKFTNVYYGLAIYNNKTSADENGHGDGFGVVVDIYSSEMAMTSISGNLQPVDINNPYVPKIHVYGSAKMGQIYAAGYGIWTFDEGCQVTDDEALSIKSGKFIINGGTFTGNGEFVECPAAWSNGMNGAGAAIQVQSNDGYAGNVELIINGGKFISENGFALVSTSPVPSTGKVPKNVFKKITIDPNVDVSEAFTSSAKPIPSIYVLLNVSTFGELQNAVKAGLSAQLEDNIAINISDSLIVTRNVQPYVSVNLTDKNIYAGTIGIFKGFNKTLPNAQKEDVILTANKEEVLKAGTYYPVYQYNISDLRSNSASSSSGDTDVTIGDGIPETIAYNTMKQAYPGQLIKLEAKNISGYPFVKYDVTTTDGKKIILNAAGEAKSGYEAPVTFTMPAYDVAIQALYITSAEASKEYNITVVNEDGGSIAIQVDGASADKAKPGHLVNITGTKDDYTLSSVIVNTTAKPSGELVTKLDGNLFQFIMPSDSSHKGYDVNVTAAFTKNEVPVVPPAPSSGDSSSSSDNDYDYDDDSSSSSTTTTPTVNPTQKPTVTPTPTVKPTPEPKTVVIVETEVKFEDNKVITSITVPEGSSGSITFTQTEEKGMDEWIPESIEDTYSFDLSCDGEINGDSEIHFVMSDTILKSLGLTPDDVCLKHFENGVWVKLKISYIVLDDGTYYFTAITKSFSPFKISFDGKSEDEPTVTPTEEQPTKSPMPIVGLLMGLGAAALVLRRK